MKNILVSGASSIVGLGILKSLRMSNKQFNLIGTSCFDDTVLPAFCDVFVLAPITNDDNYFEWLNDTIEKFQIDIIIPGIDVDMHAWNENFDKIKGNNLKILLNNRGLINLCSDKWSFYENLNDKLEDFIIPTSLSNDFNELKTKFGLPLFLKPRKGFGSKGIEKVFDEESFQLIINKIGNNLMVQPLIGNDDEEYTTSVFGDGKGSFFTHMTLKRKLSKSGYTEKAEVVELNGVEEVIKLFCQILLPIGPTNFQFRKDNGTLKLLEINPRISSSTSIRSAFGYNESEMVVDYFLEGRIPVQPKLKKGKAIRYVEDYIFLE